MALQLLDSPWLVVGGPATVLALALPVLWLALRGRRVDDHPLCRRCGFDLFGKPAESTRCPECGADLGRGRAVRVGNRQARRRLLAAALPPALLCAGWLGVVGYGTARGTDWNRWKPVWWLVNDLEGRHPPARLAAVVELDARVADGRLPAAAARALVDDALARQADPKRSWVPGHGLLLERLHANNRLDRPDWQRYLGQTVRFRAEPVSVPDASGRFAVRLTGDVRVGADNRFALQHSVYGQPVVGGRAFRAVADPAPIVLLTSAPAGTQVDVTIAPASRHAPPPGTHPVEVPLRVTVDPNGMPVAATTAFGRAPDPEYRSNLVLRTTLVVPPATASGTPLPGGPPVAAAAAKRGQP